MAEAILFKGKLASSETKYVNVPVRNGTLGAHIGWLDAVSSATITLELGSFEGASIDGEPPWGSPHGGRVWDRQPERAQLDARNARARAISGRSLSAVLARARSCS